MFVAVSVGCLTLNGTIGRLMGREKKVRAVAAAINAPNAWRVFHDPDLTMTLGRRCKAHA
ncbi:hypothetical protein [Azospirillum sp.]|uniref:hypothetical protein n=1 Tax=Azospirillum sp. TaxID=34012 RepID=UPI003D715403